MDNYSVWRQNIRRLLEDRLSAPDVKVLMDTNPQKLEEHYFVHQHTPGHVARLILASVEELDR